MTMKVLTSLRNEVPFNLFCDNPVKEPKEYNFDRDLSKPRKRKVLNYSILEYFNGAESSANAYHPDTPRAYFRGIYYEAMNSVVSVVETHLNQPCNHAYEVMGNLLLKMVKKEDTSAEQDFMETTYANDINTAQLQIESGILLVMFHN